MPSWREKTLARMVATPKSTPPTETTALATAKKMVNDTGPALRDLLERLVVAVQGKPRSWIKGKPTVKGIPAASTAVMPAKPRMPLSARCQR